MFIESLLLTGKYINKGAECLLLLTGKFINKGADMFIESLVRLNYFLQVNI